MVSKTNIKQFFLKLLMFLISLVTILSSSTMYSLNNGYIILEVILACLFILMFLIDPLWNITYNFLLILLLYIIIAIILCFASNFSNYSLYTLGFLAPLCLLISNYIFCKHKVKFFLESLYVVLTAITIISLIFWVLGSNLHLLSPNSSMLVTWGDTPRQIASYFNLYFEPQGMPIDGIISQLNIMGLSRNSSIFIEAVIANFFFSMGFILSEILDKNKKYKLIYLIAIISTFTTSGFLVAGLFILYSVIKITPKNILIKFIKIFTYSFTIIFVIYFVFLLIANKTDTISGNTRRIKITSELAAFLKSPIYGNGINIYTRGSSNALSAVAADGGILLFMLYYFPLIKLTIDSFIRINARLILFVSIFFLFGASVVQYTPFVLIAVALGWEMILMNRTNLRS
ncbi:hypothetical protein QUW45_05805 [Limosilactobacillus pontis]|uniref:hypothetical protein n=1 Tax=Limosilactobacillus pontis TaxID=35787 RepID=UPI0025A3B820|nr:hypothetical protein [Limosilactobacillus pontis]MDM8332198.1 hypothetical protein [Limosilactobacillus pontis]